MHYSTHRKIPGKRKKAKKNFPQKTGKNASKYETLLNFIFLDDDANLETLVVVFLTCLNFCHRLKVLGTLSASWRTALLLRLPRFLRQSKGTVFFGSFLAVASTVGSAVVD